MYLAPEVLDGGPTSVRSDVYSLGVLLHHLATGSFPVRASSTDALRDAHRRGLRTTVRDARPDLPPRLASIIDRATAPDEDTRFESAAAFELAMASVEPERRRATVALPLVGCCRRRPPRSHRRIRVAIRVNRPCARGATMDPGEPVREPQRRRSTRSSAHGRLRAGTGAIASSRGRAA